MVLDVRNLIKNCFIAPFGQNLKNIYFTLYIVNVINDNDQYRTWCRLNKYVAVSVCGWAWSSSEVMKHSIKIMLEMKCHFSVFGHLFSLREALFKIFEWSLVVWTFIAFDWTELYQLAFRLLLCVTVILSQTMLAGRGRE